MPPAPMKLSLKTSAYTGFSLFQLPLTVITIRQLKYYIQFSQPLCVPHVSFFKTQILSFEKRNHNSEPQTLLGKSLLSLHNSLPPNHELIKTGTEIPKRCLLHDKYKMGAVNLI